MPVIDKPPRWNPWTPWQVLVIVAVVLGIYGPALNGGWQWDDDLYLTRNPLMVDPARLWKAWFAPGSFIEYYPISQTVQWMQWQLWHGQTLGYHVTNVLLHAAGALLVWRLLARLGLRYAWLGGLLFAVHPAQVESVAWISELKNALSLPPFLLAMCAWIDYEERQRPRDYAIALAWFVVAMLGKITMAPFAFVMLLYAWWKRGRVGWAEVKAALPFLAVAVVLSALTIKGGETYLTTVIPNSQAPPSGAPEGLAARIALSGSSLAFYLRIFLWPVGLLPAYSKWVIDPPAPLLFLPWLVLAAVVIWAWTRRHSWGRHVLLGLGFFRLFLAPFLGLSRVSYMQFTWVMNHFLYLPSIGLIGLAVAGLEKAMTLVAKEARPGLLGIVGVMMALLAWVSEQDAARYRNAETLWTYAAQRDPTSFAAHTQLGVALQQRGEVAGALKQFEQAREIEPDFAYSWVNVGFELMEAGRAAEAAEALRQAVKLAPNYADAHYNLAEALEKNGQTSGAVDEYEQSLRLSPQDAEAETNLALALMQLGRRDEAATHFARAMAIRPGYAEAQYDWGTALLEAHDAAGAVAHFERALAINPSFVEAHFNLGVALQRLGRMPEAIAQLQAALKLRPGFSPARSYLAQLHALPPGE
jgi:tetratricopeptide (TPR) repeat protein